MSDETLPFCECGCGNRVTGRYKRTRGALGHVKGQPLRRISGHSEDTLPFDQRFWPNVDRNGPNGCWLWTAGKTSGYGTFNTRQRDPVTDTRAHRITYTLLVGPIPEGLSLDHLCENKACCNPEHLEPVTHTENVRRASRGCAARTHCPRGHEYSPENTYRDPGGGRRCRKCARITKREWERRTGRERPPQAKLDHDKADAIRRAATAPEARDGERWNAAWLDEVAAEYGITVRHLYDVLKGRYWPSGKGPHER